MIVFCSNRPQIYRGGQFGKRLRKRCRRQRRRRIKVPPSPLPSPPPRGEGETEGGQGKKSIPARSRIPPDSRHTDLISAFPQSRQIVNTTRRKIVFAFAGHLLGIGKPGNRKYDFHQLHNSAFDNFRNS